MFKLVHFMAVLIVMASVCTALAAQSYGRTDTTTTYVERAGIGAALPLADDGFDDGAKFVPLPWDFPFFDRTYKGCWMNTNGRIHFSDEAVDDYDIIDLTTPISEEDVTEAINVYAGDIAGSTEWDRDSQFTVHYESDRVVFQWRGVANYESDEYGTRLNFQCHILQSGEIRLYMGPNRFFINDFEEYVSGIVNADGSQSFAGFNNSLLIQQAVPASGNTITFTPTGYTQADGIVAGPRYGADYTSKVYFEGDTDVVVAQFCLQANGTGGTVTEIGIDNSTPTAGNNLSLKLYLDAGTLGAVDGADTLLGTQATTTGFTTFSGLTEVLDGTTPLRNYLLVADVTAIDETFTSYFYFDIDDGDIVSTASIWGGYLKGSSSPDNPEFTFLEGPFVEFNVSDSAGRFASVTAGGAEVAITSFEVALRESNATSVELNSFEVLIALTGMAIADVSQIALYRDAGSVGQLDASDTLLATVANPTTTTIAFTALTESMTSQGQDYIITAMVGTSYTTLAVGGISATVVNANEVFSVAKAFWQACDNSGSDNLSVLPNAAAVFLHDTEETRFDSGRLRVLQGATDVPALQFTLQATSGSQNVTVIDVVGDGTELSAARLYLDNGTMPGRVDAGDTLVATASTLSATNVTFTGLGEAITTSARAYIVAMDVSGTATAGTNIIYSLDTTGVTVGVTVIGQLVQGGLRPIDAATDGVDVTVNLVAMSGSISGSQQVLIATYQQTPRGAGDTHEELRFTLIRSAGGAGESSLELVTYLEGTGPIGQLDPTDFVMVFSDDNFGPTANAEAGDDDDDWIDTTRNFLVFLRIDPDACDFDGEFEIAFRGLDNEANSAFASIPDYASISGTASVAAVSSGGGGGGGKDGGGCATNSQVGSQWLLLLSLLGLVAVAARLRRTV